jgi:hypothetical protein
MLAVVSPEAIRRRWVKQSQPALQSSGSVDKLLENAHTSAAERTPGGACCLQNRARKPPACVGGCRARELPAPGCSPAQRAWALALGHPGVGLRPLEAPGFSRGRCHDSALLLDPHNAEAMVGKRAVLISIQRRKDAPAAAVRNAMAAKMRLALSSKCLSVSSTRERVS